MEYERKLELPQVTLRATVAGLAIGSVVLVSNFQFGLQTGWVLMMLLPLALLGYAVFRALPVSRPFTDVENVFVQSVAVAAGTGPLAYGLVGIVPAIEKFLTPAETGYGRTIELSLTQLMVWCMGLALFGVFFAVPLRRQVIVKEKLPFPSGLATATLVQVLHHSHIDSPEEAPLLPLRSSRSRDLLRAVSDDTEANYQRNMRNMVLTFMVSSAVTVATYFFPQLAQIPFLGRRLLEKYLWNFQALPAYVGQGMIMGLPTVSYMLFGCLLGWAVLAPLAYIQGWAPGEFNDWKHGAQGWIIWVSLSAMVADSVVSFAVVTYRSIKAWRRSRRNLLVLTIEDAESDDPEQVPSRFLVPFRMTMLGVAVLSIICIVLIKWVFGAVIPVYAIVVALFLTFFFSILGVRALGETDLNPVSGIGKLSQLVFAVVVPSNHPARLLINLVAGGIAEAGAQQAGDLMQDLKTGHLVGALPRAQFYAQCIGTLYSVGLSSIMYKVYNLVYTIPNKSFRVPTAIIWVDCLRLVTGEGLPPKAFEFSVAFFFIFAAIAVAKNTIPRTHKYHRYLVYLPSGVAVGIGIYNTPSFTLARFLGGLVSWYWLSRSRDSLARVSMIIFSSGLVLGEGVFSAVTLMFTSLGVRHL